MASRADPIGLPRWPGRAAMLIVAALCLGTLVPLVLRAEGFALSAADLAAVRFTVLQAALSAVISVALAIPVARALARQAFRGRRLVLALLGAPFILPVIVAIFGLLAVFGRAGVVNGALVALGLPPVSIYGLQGVVLAHVFLNLPLATRLILLGWQNIPAERFRLAASLHAPVWAVLERPMLRQLIPGALMAVFLICLTSFAVALVLGGGPAATTVELAIYQALRFDFDPGRAAVLALCQFGICAVAAAVAVRIGIPPGFGAGQDRVVQRFDGRWWDRVIIGTAAVLLGAPMVAVIWRGLPGLAEVPGQVWLAALRSVLVALAAAGLAVAMALAMALRPGRWADLAAALPLATSGLVIGAGLLIVALTLGQVAMMALPVTALVNAVLALPFAYRAIRAPLNDARATQGRLAATLGLTGWGALRIALLPRLRQPLGFAAGLAAALAMGDLGVIALFASDGQETLPLLMQRLIGAYRMDAAAAVGLILISLSLGLFWAFDRGGRVDA